MAPVVVSPPSAPVVVQPSAPTVVVGPTPAPNIVFAAAAPAAPNVALISAPAAPAPNVMMAPQPMVAAAPMAPTAMVAPTAPVVNAPQSAVGTAVIGILLENPGLIRRLIGALGRLLARFGHPTVQMTTMPQTAQMPVAAPMYLAPAAAAPQPTYYVPSAPQQPQAPQPSPQGSPKHGFFHR
jgi:hypothetical protein